MIGWTDLPADLSDLPALERLRQSLPADAVVISSDLARAVATADALQGPRLRLPHDPALREMHFGAWETRIFDDIHAETPDHIRRFWEEPGDVAAPGGESWQALTLRVNRAVDRISAAHPGRDIIAVAHFGVILTQVERALRLTTVQAFAHRIEPLSLTLLREDAGIWQAVSINTCP